CAKSGRGHYDARDHHRDDGTERRSAAVMVVGIVAVGGGAVATLLGSVYCVVGEPVASVVMLVSGPIGLVAGVPVLAWGASRTRRPDATLGLGPGGATLSW